MCDRAARSCRPAEIDGRTANSLGRCTVRISGDGSRVAMAVGPFPGPKAGSVRSGVWIWDVNDGREVWHTSIEGAAKMVDLALEEDGGMVAAAFEGGIVPDETASGRSMLRAWKIPEGREVLSLSEPGFYYGGLGLRPDGSRLAILRQTALGAGLVHFANLFDAGPRPGERPGRSKFQPRQRRFCAKVGVQP